MPAHIRVGEVNMLDFHCDRVRVLATTLMPFEHAAWMEPGYRRYHGREMLFEEQRKLGNN
jgi:hypothetical protein